LLEMSRYLGFWETVVIQLGTAFLGGTLAKYEGIRVWTKIQTELLQNKMPTEDMIDGLMVFAGGIVLFTPGLITDFVGVLLLIPLTRRVFKAWIKKKFERMKTTGEAGFTTIMIES